MREPLSIGHLIEELIGLVRNGETLLEAFGQDAGAGVHEAKERAQESIAAARERFAQLQENFMAEARAAVDAGKTYLRDNPWKAVAVAASVGFLLGALLSRSRSR